MKKLFFRVLIIVSFILILVSVKADAVLASDTSPGFSVSTIPNKYQSKDRGYFDLDLLKTGQKTTLNLKIFNNSNNIATFDINVNDALTNANLILDYSGENHSNQSLFGLKLSDYVVAKTPIVTVKPQSRVTISFNVKMPSKKFDGQIVGGIYLKKHITKHQKGTKNAFGYVNTVILRNGDQSLQAEPKIIKARYISKSKVPMVEGTIKNAVQAFESIMYLKQYITDSKGKVVDTNSVGGRAVAPESQTDVYFKLQQPLNPGKYYYNFEFKTKKNRIIKSSAPFEVINTDAVTMNANGITLTMLLFILLMLIILFLLILLLIGRRRRKKDRQNKY